MPSDIYRIADLASEGRRAFATTAHVSQLKSALILQNESEISSGEDDVSDDGDNDNEVSNEDQIINEQD